VAMEYFEQFALPLRAKLARILVDRYCEILTMTPTMEVDRSSGWLRYRLCLSAGRGPTRQRKRVYIPSRCREAMMLAVHTLRCMTWGQSRPPDIRALRRKSILAFLNRLKHEQQRLNRRIREARDREAAKFGAHYHGDKLRRRRPAPPETPNDKDQNSKKRQTANDKKQQETNGKKQQTKNGKKRRKANGKKRYRTAEAAKSAKKTKRTYTFSSSRSLRSLRLAAVAVPKAYSLKPTACRVPASEDFFDDSPPRWWEFDFVVVNGRVEPRRRMRGPPRRSRRRNRQKW